MRFARVLEGFAAHSGSPDERGVIGAPSITSEVAFGTTNAVDLVLNAVVPLPERVGVALVTLFDRQGAVSGVAVDIKPAKRRAESHSTQWRQVPRCRLRQRGSCLLPTLFVLQLVVARPRGFIMPWASNGCLVGPSGGPRIAPGGLGGGAY